MIKGANMEIRARPSRSYFYTLKTERKVRI
nr:MAG TPA: hypothetical protein [Caudoviricetes sp.]